MYTRCTYDVPLTRAPQVQLSQVAELRALPAHSRHATLQGLGLWTNALPVLLSQVDESCACCLRQQGRQGLRVQSAVVGAGP